MFIELRHLAADGQCPHLISDRPIFIINANSWCLVVFDSRHEFIVSFVNPGLETPVGLSQLFELTLYLFLLRLRQAISFFLCHFGKNDVRVMHFGKLVVLLLEVGGRSVFGQV